MKKFKKIATLMIIGVALFLAGAVGAWHLRSTSNEVSTIPTDTRKSLKFIPVVIEKNNTSFATSNYKTATVENNLTLLTYIVKTKRTSVVFTQYQQPKEFIEVPDYKERFLSNVIKQQSIIQSSNGVIYIGQTAKGTPKQIGVMLEKGLIVFMNPDQAIDDDTWRSLGDALILDK